VILKITELDDSGNPTGNSMSIPFATDDADGKLEWWRKKDSDYIVVLDDITRLDKDFKWLCAHFGSSITPGANIQITVEAKATYSGSSDVVEGVLENPVTCNSLFANGSSLSGAVLIRNFRHLQNLDECATVSSLTAELDTPVLGWDTFNLRIGQYRDDYFTPEQGETISLSAYSYSPVNPNYALTLQRTGSNLCTIQNLELPNLTNSGLLGELQYDATIQRIQMQDTTVAGSTNAGALIGAVKSGTIGIENIQLQNTAVAGSPTNAGGLIGNVEGGATTIQGVEAKNTTFTDSPTNAGGLIGKVAAGTGSVSVGQSASYGPNWTDGSVSYTGTTVTASQNAGGLIGKIESGSVTLTESAAAHLADAGTSGNAGGLVGGVTGGGLTIAYSYAASGQVIANGESIEYEYEGPATTRKLKGNIQGGNAGGLVGCVSGGTATLNNVYSTASAYGTTSAGDAATRYLVGAGSATITGDAYSSGDYQTASQAATGKNDAGAPLSATVGEDGRQEGSYYHQKLFGKKFPYKTVAMMGASSSAPWLSKHIGDWTPMENLPTANWGRDLNNTTKTVQYDDVRYAWIQVPDGVTLVDDTSVITLAVSNPNADADAEAAAAVLYAYKYKEAQAVAGTLAPWKHKSATDSAWMLSNEGPKMSKDANGPGLNASASGVWLRVTLDDITTAGNRFRDLYVSVNGSLSAEKPVSVRAGIGTVETEFNALRVGAGAITLNDWDGSNPKEYPNTGNVLFDIKDTAGNAAAITNIRHLQNLDASVSGVGTAIETATLEKDLNWTAIDNAEFGAWSAKSIQLDGRSTTNYFHGIRNESLTRFEGVGTSGKTLSGFVITGDATDKDAGLFRELTRDVTIEKLTLTGFQVTSATDGNAGALVASTEGDVTLRNVTLDNSGGAAVTAGTNGKAGGLIASARGATIENVTLRSPAVTATGTGAAAGLIASATGEVTIQNAASNANAVTLTSPVITAANGNAAGLIASASDRVTIVNNAASNANAVTLTNASVTATNGNAAGLVASATGSGTTATNVVLTDARVTTANGNAAGLVASATGAGSETTATKVALTDPIIRATATGAAAGLVASATGGVSATDVALTNASVTATGGDAGGLIASATGAVTAKNVTLGDSADADSQKAQISAGGTGAAAGLVVSAGSATIENVKLYSPKVEATGTSGAAAGLIASATGAAQIQNSASEANAVTL
ncbi:MAG: hypothetical protein IJK52_05505, partial [Oscillospiraceae bacterium]|nr:hypothetical protein [Oscillospiraceae bacterium]